MRRNNFIIGIFLILLFIPLISAINFDMKETFHEEEILTAKLSGDFVNPPLKENILFYRGHVKIGIDVSIAKINQDYYLFAPLSGKAPENYSIVIEDVSYTKGSKVIEEDLVKNFTIIEGLADFIIDKGFVYTKDDFYIELENLHDEDLNVKMNISHVLGEDKGIINYEDDADYEFTINPGSERINFEIDVQEPAAKLIQFACENTSYVIPVSLYRDELAEASKFYSFEVEPPKINITMNLTDSRIKLIYLYNTGTGTLTGIKLRLDDSLKPYVTISEEMFGRILPNNNAHLNMSILSSGTDGKVIAGRLFIETDQGITNYADVIVETKKGYIPTEEEQAPEVFTDETCSATGGKICTDVEECSEKEFWATDGMCCPAYCNPLTPKNPLMGILGWSLLVVIVLAGVWFFFKKYKKVKKPIDLIKIAQGKK